MMKQHKTSTFDLLAFSGLIWQLKYRFLKNTCNGLHYRSKI